jgi:hypothetical protein
MKKGSKEKIIVFRHYRFFNSLPNLFTEKEMKAKLTEDQLSKGYIPKDLKFEKNIVWRNNQVKPIKYDTVYCVSGFAGKKQAREIYNKHPEIQTMDYSHLISKS